MQRFTYVFGAGLMAASMMAGFPACAEPMNDGPQGQGTPSAGAPNTGSTTAGAQPAGADRGDAGDRGNQAKDASDTKKGDEAADLEGKDTASKNKSKKAEQEDRGDGKKADRALGDKKAADRDLGDKKADRDLGDKKADRDQGDKSRQAADRKGDDKPVARDGGSQGDRARVSLDSSQRTKIQTYFRDHRPSGHRVERSAVSVSLGFAVPSTIVLAPLPSDVIVVSAACPVDYFVWADDLVLVDSCSREVVDIIPGGA